MTHPTRRTFLLLSTLLLSTGCMAVPKYMHPAPAGKPVAREDTATVVFIRPSGYGSGFIFRIMSGTGEFIGDSRAKSWFAVERPPGKQVFIGVGENTAPMFADLAPGKVYFVEVASMMGAWSGPRVHLLRLAKGTENWPQVGDWLRDTEHFVPDPAAGQASLSEDEKAKRIRRAREHLGNYSPEELAERTLLPGDGVTAL